MSSRGFLNIFMHQQRIILWFFISLLTLGGVSIPSMAAESGSKSNLNANQFIYDAEKEIIQAKGDVTLEQDGQTLQSDILIYNVRDDIATAEGNVVFTDKDNNKHRADVWEVNDQMRHGDIQNIYSVL